MVVLLACGVPHAASLVSAITLDPALLGSLFRRSWRPVGESGVTGIGFGTWSWGNQLLWGYEPDRDDPALAETLEVAVRGGLSLVDTADSYGTGRFNGRSEWLLGRILDRCDGALRAQLTVATKLAPFPWRLGRRGFDRAFSASQERL